MNEFIERTFLAKTNSL